MTPSKGESASSSDFLLTDVLTLRVAIGKTKETRDSGAADKAAIQRVRVPPCQLPDSGT